MWPGARVAWGPRQLFWKPAAQEDTGRPSRPPLPMVGPEIQQGLLPVAREPGFLERSCFLDIRESQDEAGRSWACVDAQALPQVLLCKMHTLPVPFPATEAALGIWAESTGSGSRRPGHIPAPGSHTRSLGQVT